MLLGFSLSGSLRPERLRRGLFVLALGLLLPGVLLAQGVPPHAVPEPAKPPVTAPQPPAPQQPSPDQPLPGSGEIRDLAPRPTLRLRGQSPWDEGYPAIRAAMKRLEEAAAKHGLAKAGTPLVHFVESDDLGFTFEAMLPLAAEARPGLELGAGIEATMTPAGRAMLFPHEGSYDELDAAYEAITAYLDEKGLVATGKFLEEYLSFPETAEDPGLKLNIYVFLGAAPQK